MVGYASITLKTHKIELSIGLLVAGGKCLLCAAVLIAGGWC